MTELPFQAKSKKQAPPEVRFWRHVNRAGDDECWLWNGGTSGNGYGRFRLGGKSVPMMPAHKFSFIMHGGVVPNGLYVLHRCDVRSCVNPRHLFVGDARDNALDCVAKGRMGGLFKGGADARRRHGSNQHLAKLNESNIQAIRSDERGAEAIARDYGVTRGAISRVKSGKGWRHVP